MMSRRASLLIFTCAACAAISVVPAWCDVHAIDPQRSTLTIYVFKSGLFSGFADNHVVKAPISSGSFSEDAPLAVEVAVHSADLTVMDPNLAPARRAEVQTRMHGPEVLDVTRFPDIRFTSTVVEPSGSGKWRVSGTLTLRGQSRPLTFDVVHQNGRYQGETLINQRDFGIEPIKVAGGTVKVKDQLKIAFDITSTNTGESR